MGLILSSDETQLSVLAGNVKGYPGYMTVGAISNTVPVDTSKGAMIQVFQLPILHSETLFLLFLQEPAIEEMTLKRN